MVRSVGKVGLFSRYSNINIFCLKKKNDLILRSDVTTYEAKVENTNSRGGKGGNLIV